MRVGIEVGGTFTDLLCVDGSGGVRVVKVPSVPGRPDEGAHAALRAAGLSVADIGNLVHGSTVATNAVLERSGARVAFVTTRGFRDLLQLQRQNRARIYDLAYHKPLPLVARKDCFEVTERILADGSVETPLDEREIHEELIPGLAAGHYEAVALCLLNSHANPAHERALAEVIAQRLPGPVVALSSTIAREYREYERASTAVIAAYIQPVISAYLARLERQLAERGFKGELSLIQSNGGRTSAQAMRRNPITALFSGPAAGVMGAIRQAELSGHADLITFDMGGTSTDVCLVEGGRAELVNQTEIDGLPVRTPLMDIVTVGAGCGSIVWQDDGGMLRVGPMSAGSDPGPACYGFGGDRPTVTDAHVLRGTIRPAAFLGGAMRIHPEASRQVFGAMADMLGMRPRELADAAIRLAEANIVRAIQLISTERGRDPRDYALVAFGGAGPLHAAHIAEELEIGTVLVPPHAGVLSAYGLIASDYRYFVSETHRLVVARDTPDAVRRIYQGMHRKAATHLSEVGVSADRSDILYTLEMRYVGQAFEIPVHLQPQELPNLTAEELLEGFSRAHRQALFHSASQQKDVEIVSFRLGLTQPVQRTPVRWEPPDGRADAAEAHRILVGTRGMDCALSTRWALAAGKALPGPAILEDVTSTLFVPPGWQARADGHANLILTRTS